MEITIDNLLQRAGEIVAEHRQKKESGEYFNCVEICGVGTIETRHTEIIAALLDPRSSHGFGSESLKAFFQQCDLSEFAQNCNDCYVKTEVKIPGRRPDIVIRGKNLCVVIENKTNTNDHYMQLADYRDWLKDQPETYKKLLYLTYYGDPATDKSIDDGDYLRISYKETICSWLCKCAGMANTSATFFCRQYADFIKKTVIPEGTMNNDLVKKIIESPDMLLAASCISQSFDNARFQILKNLICECYDESCEIAADDVAFYIRHTEKNYKIAFQYNSKIPYYGICRIGEKKDYTPFHLADFDPATSWWIASKYIHDKKWQCNWSDAKFLAEQWKNDGFESFKNLIRECIDNVKTVIQENEGAIDNYANEL